MRQHPTVRGKLSVTKDAKDRLTLEGSHRGSTGIADPTKHATLIRTTSPEAGPDGLRLSLSLAVDRISARPPFPDFGL